MYVLSVEIADIADRAIDFGRALSGRYQPDVYIIEHGLSDHPYKRFGFCYVSERYEDMALGVTQKTQLCVRLEYYILVVPDVWNSEEAIKAADLVRLNNGMIYDHRKDGKVENILRRNLREW